MPRPWIASAVVLAVVVLAGCSPAPSGPAAAPPSGPPVELVHDTGALTLPAPAARIVTTSDETTELVVALDLRPVGVGSTRVTGTTDEERFAGYYIPAERLGDPEFVGGEELSLEAIAALEPDLVVHGGADERVPALERIAPTAVFDVQEPGAWQTALAALGAATGRGERAAEVVRSHEEGLAAAREELAGVAARYPRVAVLYPEYRGGSDNYLFTEEFALAAVLPDLGFTLAGSPEADPAFPGVQSISTELYSTIEADAVLALGTAPWEQTTSADVLEALEAPVAGVALDAGQPSAGPLTTPDLVADYRTALLALP